MQVQEQYQEMLNDAKDYQQGVEEGSLTSEQAEQAYAMTARLKENYERLTYVFYLLQEPNRKSKKGVYSRQNGKALDYLRTEKATDGDVISEDGDVLKEFRGFIKKLTEKGGNTK